MNANETIRCCYFGSGCGVSGTVGGESRRSASRARADHDLSRRSHNLFALSAFDLRAQC